MPTLTRTTRFCINESAADTGSGRNSYAASPPMAGLGRFYEIHVACRGEVDPRTGYLINIQEIDAAVRTAAVPLIVEAARDRGGQDASALMPALCRAIGARLGAMLASVRWSLTPYYSLEMSAADPTSFLMRQQFDFAASHRLHTAALSDEENRALYGKCNNPSGHGHNYRIEPVVRVPLHDPPRFTLRDLESMVQALIIERFDHKHLNLDTEEFSARGGLNPSVENIAKVCHGLLTRAIEAHGSGARLHAVTVWETDRTSSTYPA